VKKFFFVFVIFILSSTLFSQESSIIRDFRDKIIFNVKKVDKLKNAILNDEFIDNTSDINAFKEKGLKNIYYFNKDHVMYKEARLFDFEMPIQYVHKNFLNLPVIKQSKIFLGELFIFKKEVYYFLGLKDKKKYVLLLFKLDKVESDKKYVLTDSFGEIYFLSGFNKAEAEENIKNDKNIFKFKFFPNSKVYFFMEEQCLL